MQERHKMPMLHAPEGKGLPLLSLNPEPAAHYIREICTWCGPVCLGAAGHSARLEADDRYDDKPGDRERRHKGTR